MVGRALAVIGILLLMLAGCRDDDGNARAEPETERGELSQRAEPVIERGLTKLASVELADGRRVVLKSFGGGTEVGACLRLSGVDRYFRQCGRAPSERVPSQAWRPIIAESIAQLGPDAPYEVYGATSPEVVRVGVTYFTKGSSQQQPAVLMRVSDSEALASAGIRKPFGYFLAELPADASNITARAFDSDGRELGSVSYNQLRGQHPRVFTNAP